MMSWGKAPVPQKGKATVLEENELTVSLSLQTFFRQRYESWFLLRNFAAQKINTE